MIANVLLAILDLIVMLLAAMVCQATAVQRLYAREMVNAQDIISVLVILIILEANVNIQSVLVKVPAVHLPAQEMVPVFHQIPVSVSLGTLDPNVPMLFATTHQPMIHLFVMDMVHVYNQRPVFAAMDTLEHIVIACLIQSLRNLPQM